MRPRSGAKARTKLSPQRWLYFNYAHQIVQAALTGQGVALARLPLVAESLASGDLVEPLPQMRIDSPLVYWLVVAPRSVLRPEVKAFCDWLQRQAAETRQAIGDVPDPRHRRPHGLNGSPLRRCAASPQGDNASGPAKPAPPRSGSGHALR